MQGIGGQYKQNKTESEERGNRGRELFEWRSKQTTSRRYSFAVILVLA